ncbi:MAG: hypothetical protein ACI4MP_11425 [Candidatus Ventricola sp.]
MSRFWIRAAAALFALMLLAAGAMAQETMRVFIAGDALDAQTARQLVELIGRALPQARWEAELEEETGESLRALVLSDRAPALAICAPREALPWAQEGMLLPLQSAISGQGRMQMQVLECCVLEERLFMAPLLARHRQLAVNVRRFEERRLGYMLDTLAHPVWYPTEFYQILEEFLLADEPAMDVWPAQPQTSAALEALVQALYGGSLLSGDGTLCQAGTPEIRAGLRWLGDAVAGGLIGYAQSREAALERFVSGETAIFADWTEEEAARQEEALAENGVQVQTVPYPTSIGLPVRAFTLTGVCAFASGNIQADALAVKAAALLNEDAQAQAMLGSRAIWEDNAVWLTSLDADSRGATLRSLFCEAMRQVTEGRSDAATALEWVQAAMDALK